MPRLLVIKGADEGKQFELADSVIGVGRHRERFRSYLGSILLAQVQLALPLTGLLLLAGLIVHWVMP